jgi:signal transduction histidine kinase
VDRVRRDVHGESTEAQYLAGLLRIAAPELDTYTRQQRHTPAGGNVTIGLERAENRALLWVQDTGSGIPADKLPLIFERFYRADTACPREAGGAGLGLAIVRWVAEAHGGTASVSSVEGTGSVFTLDLPLGTPMVEPAHSSQGRG